VRRRDERGAVAIIVALLVVVLVGISAFTVDYGMAYTTKRQLSSASDAAALAADMVYKTSYKGLCTVPGNDPNNPVAANSTVRATAEAAADSLFVQNFPTGSASDGSITNLSCNGTGVQVTYTANGKSSSPFGPLLGGNGTITTAGTAAAAYSVGGGICALCVLGNVNTNNTDFTVTGGDIYVDGNVSVKSQSHWIASNYITISGSSNLDQANATPDWTSGPHITDPFGSVALPAAPYAGLSDYSSNSNNNPCTIGPGVYSSWLIKNTTCTLKQGAYVFKGTLDFQSTNSHLTASGPVTLFFAGPNGKLNIKNGDVSNLSAPTTTPLPTGFPAGWPLGFAIIYSRDNTNTLDLQGNGDSFPDVTGNVYAVKSTTSFNGNACFQVSGGAVVIGGVSSVGNTSCLNVLNAKNAGDALPQNLRLTK
jgi:hypothetical protein